MPKFLCLQRSLTPSTTPAGEDCGPPEDASPADMQAMYEQFRAWQARFGDHIVDMGGKLGDGKLVTEAAPDGPLVEVKELVGGYMILSAPDIDTAIEIARGVPGLVGPRSGVEVVEIHGP